MKVCKRCLVTGLVQGVAFRMNTQREARRLQIGGWARNLPDGTVEVLACGEEQAVEELCAWLWRGPRLARVEDVQCSSEAYRERLGFQTR